MEHRYNAQEPTLYNIRVTIDKNFEIKQADAEYYSFVGQEAAGLIFARIIHPEDLSSFKKNIKFVQENQERRVTVIRLLHRLGTYSWMVVGIADYKGTIILHISDVDILNGTNQNKNPLADKYYEFLDILDGYIMQYDLVKDELVITVPGVGNQLKIYNGPFEGWKEYMLSDGVIAEGYVPRFKEFCENMLSGQSTFSAEIKYNKLFGIDNIDSCLYKCKTCVEDNGQRYVLGIIFIIKNKEDIKALLDGGRVDSGYKDFGADVLNKRAITEYTTRLLNGKPDHNVTIAIIDIDDFKVINDTYGHLFGDQVISDAANVIKRAVGNKGICGRIGGDEMFIVVENIQDKNDMRGIFRAIKQGLEKLYDGANEKGPQLTCSIGCATYPEDAQDYLKLFNIADKMLYLAKEKGKNRYIIYRENLHKDFITEEAPGNNKARKSIRAARITSLNAMIQYYQDADRSRKKELLTNLCDVFSIDEIYIYDAIKHHFYHIYGSNKEGTTEYDYVDKENYLSNFTKDGIFVIDNIDYFEGKSPEMYKLFTKVHLEQAVQYAMLHNGIVDVNIVVSFCRTTKHKKWSEVEISSLGSMGCLIGTDYERNAKAL